MSLISAALREAIVQRAGNRCEYCHLSQDSQIATFPVDHVLPIFLSGLTERENLALACPRGNAQKWKSVEATDPDTGQVVPLSNPRTQKWKAHFRWSDVDSTPIEAISAVGRATMVILDLHSSQHLGIRSLHRILPLHSPVADVSW